MEPIEDEFMREGEGYVEVCVGVSQWKTPDGRFILEEDFKVSGEVWRVHLSDADPGSVRISVCEALRLFHGGGRRLRRTDRRGGKVGPRSYETPLVNRSP